MSEIPALHWLHLESQCHNLEIIWSFVFGGQSLIGGRTLDFVLLD